MADMALIQGAISGLKIAGDIAKGFLQLKTMADVQGKVIELQSAILSAQTSAIAAQSDQFAMLEQVGALKQEIARMKAWETTKQRYELHSPYAGTFVYALKEGMGASEPAHWICAKCYEDGKRSILQVQTKGSGTDHHRCFVCNAEAITKGTRRDLGMA